MTDIQKTYYERFHALKKEREIIDESLIKSMSDLKYANPFQTQRWANIPKGQMPPVEAIGILAFRLKTNVGYLIGMNDAKDLCIKTGNVNLSLKKYENLCMEKLGKSLVASKTCGAVWVTDMKKSTRKLHRIAPLIKISEKLDINIDYILGLTKNKYIEYDIIEQELFDYLPSDLEIVIKAGTGKAYCLLSKDRKEFKLATGDKPIPIEKIQGYSPKLCEIVTKE